MEDADLVGLDAFVKKMQATLRTYEILLEDEQTRVPVKGKPDRNEKFYEGCVHVLQSLLYLASDVKRKNDKKKAKALAKPKEDVECKRT